VGIGIFNIPNLETIVVKGPDRGLEKTSMSWYVAFIGRRQNKFA